MSQTDCSCPHCKSNSTLVDYWTLFLSIEEWPAALMVLSLVAIFSRLLTLSAAMSATFSIISILPVVFLISRKKSCLNCGIDFETSGVVPVRTNRRDDYKPF